MNVEFLFGGTFDPVHFGHLAILDALEKLAPQITVRLVPCAIPVLKEQPGTCFEQRTEMLKLATEGRSNLIIDKREQTRQRPSYTIETLQSLRKEFPEKTFIMVIGGDSALDLPRWYQWQKLTTACHLLVINRPGSNEVDIRNVIEQSQFTLCESFSLLTQKSSGLGYILKMPEKPQSSTQVRQSISDESELDSMLPQAVIEYIHDHHLYPKPTFTYE